MQLTITAQKSFAEFTLEADLVTEGDRCGIFGTSGSGKSTLVGMLAGRIR